MTQIDQEDSQSPIHPAHQMVGIQIAFTSQPTPEQLQQVLAYLQSISGGHPIAHGFGPLPDLSTLPGFSALQPH